MDLYHRFILLSYICTYKYNSLYKIMVHFISCFFNGLVNRRACRIGRSRMEQLWYSFGTTV